MPSPRDLRRRIKSIRNTSQITKAMQMVAAAKMRKAQQAAVAGRPYASLMNEVLAEVTANAGDFSHPLMEVREIRKRAVIVVSTDKGLCGALNSNLLREAARFDKDLFTKGDVDAVDILFTNFISTLVQKPEMRTLLPVGEIKAVHADLEEGAADSGKLLKGATEFLFEPGADQVLGSLLPHYLNFQVYQILLEAKASEHSSRMVAMKNATDNAKQLIKDLTLEYNKLRQANITKELLEITSAAMAMG